MNGKTFDSVLRAERAMGQPVHLLSRIVGCSVGLTPDGQVGQRLRFCALRSADLRDSALCTSRELLALAEEALHHGYPVVLSGRFVPEGPAGPPAFVLQGIEPVHGAVQLLCPRPEELQAARTRLGALRDACTRDPTALQNYILREACLLLGLRGGAPLRHRQMQLGVLLQALSGGAEGQRLALLTLGRPGRSKRTLALLAQLLSPLAMMGHGATLTPSALCGALGQGSDGRCIDPGMLLRGDVVIIEDFHALRRHRELIQHALCEAIEEGHVVPVGADERVGPPLRCDVAVYLDLSLDAALHGVVPGKTSLTLLGSPGFGTELLSRMDIICCVDAGNDGSRSERGELWPEAARPPARPVEEDLVQRRRDLQLLVALIRDEIPHVALDPVAEDLVTGFFDRSAQLAAGRTSQPSGTREVDAAAFLRRGSLSLRRLCAAAARARLREVAGREDAELALQLFSLKIETLTWLWQARL